MGAVDSRTQRFDPSTTGCGGPTQRLVQRRTSTVPGVFPKRERERSGDLAGAGCAAGRARGIDTAMAQRFHTVFTLLVGLAAASARGAPSQEAPENPSAAQAAREKTSPRAASAERLAWERKLAERVDPQRAQRRVRELVALGPRMGGTRSGDAAAAWSADAFRGAGLDARTVDDPEKDAYQPLAWKAVARKVASGEALRLERAWPWTGSPDGAGKLELVLESRPGAAWLTNKPARGPSNAALVLVDGAVNIDGEHPVVGTLRGKAAQPCLGLSRPEGAKLREWLAAGERVEIEFELRGDARRAKPKTVVARLRSNATVATEPGEWSRDYFLFCAHGDSDSGGPGANDNASGIATLLEIASAWQAALDAGEVQAPPCEIRFAIWGSEIFSTRDYLETRIPSEGACLGVVNYDQAGFGSGADQLNLEPDDLPANRTLIGELLGVLRDHAPKDAAKPGAFPAHWATNRSLGGTDSYVFSKADYFRSNLRPSVTVFASAWGAPAEHKRSPDMPGESWRERDEVSVDYDAYYHSSGDTPANTTDKEPWNMAWCARVGMLGVARYVEALAAAQPAAEAK
jgi:hypothetical protein